MSERIPYTQLELPLETPEEKTPHAQPESTPGSPEEKALHEALREESEKVRAEEKQSRYVENASADERTPKELREELREKVQQLRSELLTSEQAVLTHERAEPHSLERIEFEQNRDEKALAYEQALEEHLAARLEDRTDLDDTKKKRIMNRYRRSVIWRDVIARAEREHVAAAAANTAERGGDSFPMKALRHFAAANATLDAGLEKTFGKVAPRVFRAGVSGLLGTLAVVAFGPASITAAGAMFASKTARSLLGTTFGGLTGAGVGKLYEKNRFNKKAKTMSQVSSATKDIEKKRRAYHTLSPEAIQRKRGWIQAGTALLSGAGLSEAIIQLPDLEHFVHTAATTLNDTPGQYTAIPTETPGANALSHNAFPSPLQTPGPQAEHLSRAAEAIAPQQAPALEVNPVHAVAGRGYEEMLFTMGQELRDKYPHGLPANVPHDSDAWKLWHAASSGNASEALQHTVHRMAADAQHHFFNTDTHESVLVNQDSQIRLSASGNVEFAQHGQHFAEGAPTDATMTGAPEHASATPTEAGPTPAEAPHAAAPVPETPARPYGPDPAGFYDAGTSHTAHPGYLTDQYGNIVHDRFGAPIHTGNMNDAAAQAALQHAHPGEIINQFNVPVAEHASHIYAGTGKDVFVFGGSSQEQSTKALEYLRAHPKATVFGTALNQDGGTNARIAFKLVNGALVASPPLRTSGFFGFFGSWVSAPEPTDFRKLLD